MNGRFVEVLPPKEAPVDQLAEAYGLCPGLRAEVQHYGAWRCANCSRMQRDRAVLVWVPDSVQMGDPVWAIVEQGRQNALNGCGSGWCLPCAKLLCARGPVEVVKTFWQRLFS